MASSSSICRTDSIFPSDTSAKSSIYVLYLQVPVELRDYYEEAALNHNKMIDSMVTYDCGISTGDFNAGFDLVCPIATTINGLDTVKLNHEIKAAMDFFTGGEINGLHVGYYLYPRSSTGTKTPLRLANSVGIIDSGYRGNIIAVFDNWKNTPFNVDKLQRLVQICPPNMTYPMRVVIVDELNNNTLRGEGGFGSTGK